jgi:hypothetical protein
VPFTNSTPCSKSGNYHEQREATQVSEDQRLPGFMWTSLKNPQTKAKNI